MTTVLAYIKNSITIEYVFVDANENYDCCTGRAVVYPRTIVFLTIIHPKKKKRKKKSRGANNTGYCSRKIAIHGNTLGNATQ